MTGTISLAIGAAGAANCLNYTVGVANNGSGIFGYVSTGSGTLSPTTLKGVTINQLIAQSGTRDLTLTLVSASALTQSFFRHLVIETQTSDVWVPFTSAQATFNAPGGNIYQWLYGSGIGPVWTGGSITRRVLIFP